MQGGSFAFLPQVNAILSDAKYSCHIANINNPTNVSNNIYKYIDVNGDEVEFEEFWTRRMQNIQGAIILAGVLELCIGSSGIVGHIMRFIGPLTISPVICLIGLSVMDAAIVRASQNWIISIFCILTIIICSQG